jgi:hypothetical protein
MSQVLKYGIPVIQRLLCENPVCDNSATMIAHVAAPGSWEKGGSPESQHPESQHPEQEICGCDEHIRQLITGRRVLRYTLLTTPGQPNPTK